MKHLFKHAAFAAFIGAMAFTACNDDDNNIQIDRDLSGEYKSEVNVTVTEIGADESEKELGTYLVPQQFTVAQSADGNEYMDLTIKGIKFDDQSWGDLTLTHLKAGRYADRYTIVSESDQSMSINGLGNCTVSLIGSGKEPSLMYKFLKKSFELVQMWDKWGVNMRPTGDWECKGHALPGKPRAFLNQLCLRIPHS